MGHFNNSFISKKVSYELSGDVYNSFDGALDQFYPWVHSTNSFISRRTFLDFTGDGYNYFGGALDQLYAWVYSTYGSL